MEDCLFCKIVAGKIPATIALESDDIIAFHDIRPQAPTHVLFIPRRHIATINDCVQQDDALIGRMVLAAKAWAVEHGLAESGYRLVFNVNSGGGQEIYHIHLHLLAGRQMTWPPG